MEFSEVAVVAVLDVLVMHMQEVTNIAAPNKKRNFFMLFIKFCCLQAQQTLLFLSGKTGPERLSFLLSKRSISC